MRKLLLICSLLIIHYSLLITPAYAVDLQTQYGFGFIKNAGDFISKLIMPVFDIAGVALVFYMVFAAFKYMTSAGDKEAIAQARGMITHSVIGILLLIMLFLILEYLPGALGIPGISIIGR